MVDCLLSSGFPCALCFKPSFSRHYSTAPSLPPSPDSCPSPSLSPFLSLSHSHSTPPSHFPKARLLSSLLLSSFFPHTLLAVRLSVIFFWTDNTPPPPRPSPWPLDLMVMSRVGSRGLEAGDFPGRPSPAWTSVWAAYTTVFIPLSSSLYSSRALHFFLWVSEKMRENSNWGEEPRKQCAHKLLSVWACACVFASMCTELIY